jgi:hypothetical protein
LWIACRYFPNEAAHGFLVSLPGHSFALVVVPARCRPLGWVMAMTCSALVQLAIAGAGEAMPLDVTGGLFYRRHATKRRER